MYLVVSHWSLTCLVSVHHNLHRVSKSCAKQSELRQISTNFDNFGRKMAKRVKLCEMHSFSISPNSRHHTTVLNADVRNCYTTLKVVISSKLSNDLNSTSKVKCGLLSIIISSYNSSVQNCQNLCSKWAPHTRTQALRRCHRKREAALAASRFLWRCRICGFTVTCHCTELKGLKCAIVCYFQGWIFNPTNLLNHVAPFIELMVQMWASNTNNYCVV